MEVAVMEEFSATAIVATLLVAVYLVVSVKAAIEREKEHDDGKTVYRYINGKWRKVQL
jgi:hypothetical protein